MKRTFQRFLASLLIVCLAGLGLPVQAGMLPTEAAVTNPDRTHIFSVLDRQDVRAQLQAHGVSSADVKARVAAMTDEEVRALAGQIESLPAGGDILGVILIVFLVLLLTDILGFTKIFPFTRSIR
jgi:predicted small lipoprotein YifL